MQISVDLSQKGIADLKKQLLSYKNGLQNKVQNYVEMLSKIGLQVISSNLQQHPLGNYVTVNVDIDPSSVGCKSIITAIGETKQGFKPDGTPYEPFNILLAIEFGSGIYYNPIAHPDAEDLGFGVGSFPNQIHAFEDGWYYWDESLGKWRYTHGIQATMPMYQANIAMILEAKNIAKEVFG